jgi:hypothetical protein
VAPTAESGSLARGYDSQSGPSEIETGVSNPALKGILTPPPERRIYPAAPVPLARLPDESGVPVGMATRLGGGAKMPALKALSQT